MFTHFPCSFLRAADQDIYVVVVFFVLFFFWQKKKKGNQFNSSAELSCSIGTALFTLIFAAKPRLEASQPLGQSPGPERLLLIKRNIPLFFRDKWGEHMDAGKG